MSPKADADALTAPTAAVQQEDAAGEALWIEVIRKMDETYADLVPHQEGDGLDQAPIQFLPPLRVAAVAAQKCPSA